MAGFLPGGLAGQEGVLERWTLGSLAANWAPRWDAGAGDHAGGTGEPPRVVVVAGAEILRFGSSLRYRASSVAVAARQAVGDVLAVRATAVSESSWSRVGGRPLLESARSQAFAAGLVASDQIGAARVSTEGLVGWDEGWGGEARLSLESRWQSLVVWGWRSNARPSRVILPADSLRDIGVEQRGYGVRIDGVARAPLRALTLEARGHWSRDYLDARSGSSDAFFATSPTGASEAYGVGLALEGRLGRIEGAHRWRSIDLESVVTRGGVTAGRLFFADADVRGWTGALRPAWSSGRWSLLAGGEHVTGRLSTRIETWPFVSIWEQLSVQAYRLQGGLDSQASWLGARRDAVDRSGWSVGAHVARIELLADRRSWYVTSLGFGRTDETSSTQAVDPAWMLGGSIGRVFTIGRTTASLRAEGGLPVHAKRTAGTQPGADPAGREDEGLSGYVTIVTVLTW